MSKITVGLLTLCDYALTSQQGKLSVMGIFDRVFVSQLPTKYPRFFVVAILSAAAGRKSALQVQMLDPKGEPVLPSREVSVTFGGNGKANLLMDIANLNFTQLGGYHLVVVESGKEIGRASFFVSRLKTADKITDN